MIKYLKYIVIIFGSIGILVGSFFYYQNRQDISMAMEYNKILDYEYLKQNCLGIEKEYYFPCLKNKFAEYLKKVSLTGTNMGMKMVFTVMDDDKDNTKIFTDEKHKNIEYSINYLEINNMAIANAYKRYFGMEMMYGGFLATLENKFYVKAYEFSDNLIIGLDSHDGIQSIKDEQVRDQLNERFQQVKSNYYQLKEEVTEFLAKETKRLSALSK